jgi:hypothetical protein
MSANNNRFNVLLEKNKNNNEDVKRQNNPPLSSSTYNSFKSDSFNKNNINLTYERRNETKKQEQESYRNFMQEKLKKQKKEELIKALDVSCFPELKSKNPRIERGVNVVDADIDYNTKSYIDMMKNNSINLISDNEESVDEYVRPGWVSIKLDKNTNKIVWKCGDKSNISNNEYDIDYNDKKCTTPEDPLIVFQRLTDLYKKRKYDHIKKWGLDEYDKMFMFQNYNYNYFDNLDEAYEKEIEKTYKYYNTNYTDNNLVSNEFDNDY